jgi:hypothetical protein
MKRSRIQCKKCGDVVESKHRHDFRSCSCRSVHLDGGLDYQRCLWPGGNKSDWFTVLGDDDVPALVTQKDRL